MFRLRGGIVKSSTTAVSLSNDHRCFFRCKKIKLPELGEHGKWRSILTFISASTNAVNEIIINHLKVMLARSVFLSFPEINDNLLIENVTEVNEFEITNFEVSRVPMWDPQNIVWFN